jgi:outer membrane protein OmpA-like peptidoglycan-associated protein/tetratricopeptide (TPR) repeat protein
MLILSFLFNRAFSIQDLVIGKQLQRITVNNIIMRKITPLVIFFLCVFFVEGFAAEGIRKAQRKIRLYDYTTAITVLKKVVDKNDPRTKDQAIRLLAECYRKKNDFSEAKTWYGKIMDGGHPDSATCFYYAMALRSLGEYENARRFFLKYDSIVQKDQRGKIYAGFCDSVRIWNEKNPEYDAINISKLNSAASEFGPVFLGNKVCYTSDRYMENKKRPVYGWTGNNYLRIFYADLSSPVSDEDYGDPYIDKAGLNSKFHNGPASFDSSGTVVYFTRTLKAKGERDPFNIREDLLKIYSSTFADGKWTRPQSFQYNSNEHSIGHPAISRDGNTLYFVSNMPGGYGGTDIYMCQMIDGKWSKPQNLGPKINTFGNEMFPYLTPKGEIYFSSDGLPGYGSLDIFVTKKENGEWSAPVNLGRSINTSYDDFANVPFKNAETKTGVFSSNRPGGQGEDDLYLYKEAPPKPKVQPQYLVSGCVKEKETNQRIPWATVFLYNKSDGKVLVVKADGSGCFRTPVALGTNYLAKAMQKGYSSDCESFFFDLKETQTDLSIPRDLLLEKLTPTDIKLGNIYYDFDKSVIRPDAIETMDSLVMIMKEYNITVELGSHADCRGTDMYNQKLSERRAESARQYLISHGIDPSRIKTQGYGEQRPVNKCVDGIQCTETQYQANRRTEFKLISDSVKQPESFDINKYGEGESIDIKSLPGDFFSHCRDAEKIAES